MKGIRGHITFLLCALVILGQGGMAQAAAGDIGMTLEQGLARLATRLADGVAGEVRPVVAVASFRDVDNRVTTVGRYLAMKMPHFLLDKQRFRVVVRDDLDTLLDTLMEERKDIYDPATVAALGRLVGAQGLVLGQVMNLGDRLRLHVWLIDTERRIRLASAAVSLSYDERLEMLVALEEGKITMDEKGDER